MKSTTTIFLCIRTTCNVTNKNGLNFKLPGVYDKSQYNYVASCSYNLYMSLSKERLKHGWPLAKSCHIYHEQSGNINYSNKKN